MTAPNNPTPELVTWKRFDYSITNERFIETVNGSFVLHSEAAATISRLTAERDATSREWRMYKRAMAAEQRVKELEAERYELACVICGGEDAPGLLDSLTVEQIEQVHADNLAFTAAAQENDYGMVRDMYDAERASNELLSERVAVLDTALEPFAKAADQRQVMCDDAELVTWSAITVGDLRRAKAAREGK